MTENDLRHRIQELMGAVRTPKNGCHPHANMAAWETDGRFRAATWWAHYEAPNPRRLLVCGDWHGSVRAVAGALAMAEAEGCQAIVQVGDFGMWPRTDGLRYLDAVEQMATAAGIVVYWVDGNHEDFAQLYRYPVIGGWRPIRPNVVHIPRGHVWSWSGRTLAGLGGAVSVDRYRRVDGESWWAQEAISGADLDVLEAAMARAGAHRVDVIFTHDAPSEARIPIRPGGWPADLLDRSDANRRMIDHACDIARPKLLIHGHYHVRYTDPRCSTPSGTPVDVVGLAMETDAGAFQVLDLPR